MKYTVIFSGFLMLSASAQAQAAGVSQSLGEVMCDTPQAESSFRASLAVLSDAIGIPSDALVTERGLVPVTVNWFNAAHQGVQGMNCSWAPQL